MWQYRWESPDPRRWRSHFTFSSYEAAKLNAIKHARQTNQRKFRRFPALEKNQVILVWRSLRRAGWRIRRRKQIPAAQKK